MPKIPQIAPNPNAGLNTQPLEQAAYRAARRGLATASDYQRGFEKLGEGIDAAQNAYGAMHEVPKLAEDRIDREAQSVRYANQFWNGGVDADGNKVEAADPHDPDALQHYRDGLNKIWDGYGDDALSGFGSKTARAWKDESLNKYTTLGLADAGAAAAGSIHDGILNFAAKASDIAYTDPTQYQAVDKQLVDYVDAQIATLPNLSPEQAATVRTEYLREGRTALAQAALRAVAERGGSEPVRQAIATGQFDGILTGKQLSEAQDYADVQQRASIEALKSADALKRKQEDDQFSAAMTNFYTGMAAPDGTLRIPPDATKQLVQLSLTPGGQRHASEIRSTLEMIARINKDTLDGKNIQTDPRTYADFSHRMSLPDTDPHALTYTEVNEARADGKLSDHDHAMFRQAIADNTKDPKKRDAYQQFNKQMSTLRGAITKSNILSGFTDSAGDQRYSEFLRYERTQMDSHFQKGDWERWMDSGQLAKDATRFAPQFSANQDISKPAPFVAPPRMGVTPQAKRNPGETPDQYLKRIGKE